MKKNNTAFTFSYVGHGTVEKSITVSENIDLGEIVLTAETEELNETLVSTNKPTLVKEGGNLVFNVENTSLTTGSTFDLLKKTPGVLVVGNELKIKFDSPVIYINNKRTYLSSSEVVTLLQNVEASIVKSVEVITNPSVKYDAEASTVLNINTTRAISVGYKGSVSGRYEQAVYPKYNLATSHFYKSKGVNLFGSYSFSPRKEFKEDDNYARFFNPDQESTKSIWESYFTRSTKSYAHQGVIIADFTINQKNTLSFSSNLLVVPNTSYNNTVDGTIYNPQRQIDSTFVTGSNLENDKHNLSFNASHKILIGSKGANITTAANYINYNNEQLQDVSTNYFFPNGSLTRNNSFFTESQQKTNVFTGQIDAATPFIKGTLESGLKYSNIETSSSLGFFDIESGTTVFNTILSDVFKYDESIFAGYINFSRNWEKWSFNAGLRAEQTSIDGNSQSLGIVNTQDYFELFPSVSVDHTLNENNTIGFSYARKINRPRYQSLNPFRYFINENIFNGGNPNLVPAFDDKIKLSYSYKRKWFFDLYYQTTENALNTLTFQDNQNETIRNVDSNLIEEFQYSFDVVYASPIANWWYLSVVTSSFYFENSFFSEESIEEKYSNDTFGFFAQMYSGLTISSKHNITSDVTLFYLSNFISGSLDYKNQFSLSVSFRKKFWDNRASLSIGVDDIFDTNNIPVTSNYYNQDNSYFARAESRLFRIGFRYNFGNARLKDNNRRNRIDEGDRLN